MSCLFPKVETSLNTPGDPNLKSFSSKRKPVFTGLDPSGLQTRPWRATDCVLDPSPVDTPRRDLSLGTYGHFGQSDSVAGRSLLWG